LTVEDLLQIQLAHHRAYRAQEGFQFLPPAHRRSVQPGVLDDDGGLRGERGEEDNRVGGIGVRLGRTKGEDAQEPIPVDHWDSKVGYLRVLDDNIRIQRPGILAHVGHRQRLPRRGYQAGQALPDCGRQNRHLFRREQGGRAAEQDLAFRIEDEQPHTGLALDDRRVPHDGLKALFEIERRGDRLLGL
jgi:hypothetical protein